jgi:hypothetical protein
MVLATMNEGPFSYEWSIPESKAEPVFHLTGQKSVAEIGMDFTRKADFFQWQNNMAIWSLAGFSWKVLATRSRTPKNVFVIVSGLETSDFFAWLPTPAAANQPNRFCPSE